MRTAKEIRDHLKDCSKRNAGGVYMRPVFAGPNSAVRIINAREQKGQLQVLTPDGWHTVLIGDEIWSVDR